ncbi:hypothetical protein [Corynebacterium glyciniphilum]|nr:hypothetical protein [Corynebacterium glyciniphilum]
MEEERVVMVGREGMWGLELVVERGMGEKGGVGVLGGVEGVVRRG